MTLDHRGSTTGKWAQLPTLEHSRKPNWNLATVSETGGGQVDDRGHNTVVIHSGANEECDFGDDRTQQVGQERGEAAVE